MSLALAPAPEHGTAAVEAGAAIDRALEIAERSGGQGAGHAQRSERMPRIASGGRAAKWGRRDRKGRGRKGRRRRAACLSFDRGPSAANARRWRPVARDNLDHGDCSRRGGNCTRGGALSRQATRISCQTGRALRARTSPDRPVSKGKTARVMRATVLHSGGPDRRHRDEIRQRDQLPHRIRQ